MLPGDSITSLIYDVLLESILAMYCFLQDFSNKKKKYFFVLMSF